MIGSDPSLFGVAPEQTAVDALAAPPPRAAAEQEVEVAELRIAPDYRNERQMALLDDTTRFYSTFRTTPSVADCTDPAQRLWRAIQAVSEMIPKQLDKSAFLLRMRRILCRLQPTQDREVRIDAMLICRKALRRATKFIFGNAIKRWWNKVRDTVKYHDYTTQKTEIELRTANITDGTIPGADLRLIDILIWNHNEDSIDSEALYALNLNATFDLSA